MDISSEEADESQQTTADAASTVSAEDFIPGETPSSAAEVRIVLSSFESDGQLFDKHVAQFFSGFPRWS